MGNCIKCKENEKLIKELVLEIKRLQQCLNESRESGIKEIIIDKNHTVNFNICKHVRGEIVVTENGIKAVCKLCGTEY